MNQLHIYNCQVMNSLKTMVGNENLSFPLLVSSKISKSDKKILYIGQETNTWCGKLDDQIDVEILEDRYLNFINDGARNQLFWKFIKELVSENQFSENLIWANTFICGRFDQKGTPIISSKLEEISVQYLTFIYQYFNPFMTIIVAGPNNPYYNVIRSFLQNIGADDMNYPCKEEKIIVNDRENIAWTYHPNYLNYQNEYNNVQKMLKKNLRK